MKVEEIMTRDVAACDRHTNAAAAAEMMWQRNCGSLPVVEQDETGRPVVVGMVTDRDLFFALGTRNQPAAELTLASVQPHAELAVCHPDDDVRQAMKTMAQRQLNRLPVVSTAGELCGILSMHDVLQHIGPKAGPSQKDVVETLRAIGERQSTEPYAAAERAMHVVA